jgi:DNA-binding XRE family transcriptional regulator
MKQLYDEQKHTTYEISKQIGKRPDYLYKYIRKEANIDNMSLKLALDIAKYENITVEEFYKKVKENKYETRK